MSVDVRRLSFWMLFKSMLSNSLLLIVLSSLFYLTKGRPLVINNCGIVDIPKTRIVGGNRAQDGAYPWMVTLHEFYYGYDHICGAAILNEYWIVTAAHCIEHPHKPWKYEAYVGVHKLSKKDRQQAKKLRIDKIILHEEFDTETNMHDIALLRIKEPIDFQGSRGYVNGICLPEVDDDPEGWAIVTGWGRIAEGGERSDVLKVVKVPIIQREICNEAYEDDTIADSQICAGAAGMDSCQNDSGGPLVQRDRNGVHTLVGIVSYGIGCGDADYPGVYTKVSAYVDWLEENIEN